MGLFFSFCSFRQKWIGGTDFLCCHASSQPSNQTSTETFLRKMFLFLLGFVSIQGPDAADTVLFSLPLSWMTTIVDRRQKLVIWAMYHFRCNFVSRFLFWKAKCLQQFFPRKFIHIFYFLWTESPDKGFAHQIFSSPSFMFPFRFFISYTCSFPFILKPFQLQLNEQKISSPYRSWEDPFATGLEFLPEPGGGQKLKSSEWSQTSRNAKISFKHSLLTIWPPEVFRGDVLYILFVLRSSKK